MSADVSALVRRSTASDAFPPGTSASFTGASTTLLAIDRFNVTAISSDVMTVPDCCPTASQMQTDRMFSIEGVYPQRHSWHSAPGIQHIDHPTIPHPTSRHPTSRHP